MRAKNNGFQFKQFFVQHDQCAMKVGTDGVLLGAWADVDQARRILDLGTGSGLISLMLAQRTEENCQIVGVELDPAAAQQASQNFAASPWAGRLQLVQQDALTFCQQTEQKFDLIVSNPPYFAQGVDCRDAQREQARYMQQSHCAWLEAATQCLTEKGKISFVLPVEAAKTLQKNTALFCAQACTVRTKQAKPPQRMLLTWQRQPCVTQQTELLVYDAQNQYSADFIALTKAFYLKM